MLLNWRLTASMYRKINILFIISNNKFYFIFKSVAILSLTDLKFLFKNTEVIELDKRKHPGYKNSYSYSSYFKFKNGDVIEIACYDYNKKLNEKWADKFTISLDSHEFNKFLLTAYN